MTNIPAPIFNQQRRATNVTVQTVLIMVNVDDVAGETIPYLFDMLLRMGAKNVHAIPAYTKKGRQGFRLTVSPFRWTSPAAASSQWISKSPKA